MNATCGCGRVAIIQLRGYNLNIKRNGTYTCNFCVRGNGKCRQCGTKREHDDKWYGNICKSCKTVYTRQWSAKCDRLARHAAAASSEKFVEYLFRHIRKNPSAAMRYKRTNLRFIVSVTLKHLLQVLKLQEGKCAISGITMMHNFGCMTSISIDRIDATHGYVDGNVQLVCRAINLMKHVHTNNEAKQFVAMLRKDSNGGPNV